MHRVRLVSLAIIFMFFLLSLGLVNLEVIQANKYKDLSSKNCIRLLPRVGARGKITDREGNIIVDTRLSYDLMLLPQDLIRQEKVFSAISEILGTSAKNLKEAYRIGYLAASMPITIAKDIDLKQAVALEELKLDLPGIIIQPKPMRHYPYARLASHVIGYVNEIDRWRLTKLADYGYKTKDIVGFGGVEEKYDYFLRQEEGGFSFEVDHQGKFVRTLGFRAPQNGKTLQLTLNLRLQKIVELALKDAKGCAIIMDPYTGEIFAMVSSPNFNPSVFVDKAGPLISKLVNDSDSPLINRAISASYPAGSLFKLIVASAALETKKLNLWTTFLCTGSALIGKQKFSCWDSHGEQNLIAAIAHSCNVFFYKTGLALGAQLIHNYALKFGLSRTTTFELPYEVGGFVPSVLWRRLNQFKNWFDGDTANLSIGQGEVLVTPLQMVRMMAVFANHGYLVTPYIVKTIGDRDISIYQRRITKLPIKESNIDYIRQGLKEVILDPKGTGNILSGLSVSLAGKTGTAQAPPGQAHAWFIGFLPFKVPKFVICVFLERGGPGYYACLLAKQIIERMISEGLI